MPENLKRSLELITMERGGGGDCFTAFRGAVKSFGVSNGDYSEICKEFGRVEIGEFEKAAADGNKETKSKTFVKERFLTFVASDETTDSYGDILRVDGADLSRLKNAGSFITSHDLHDIGGASGLIVKAKKVTDNPGSPSGKAILVTVYFPTAEEDPDADYIFKKFQAGTLRAVSVGLTVQEYYDPSDDKERKAIGLGKYGIEVKKWAPYELSAVTVGANPNALIQKGIESAIRKIMAMGESSSDDKVKSHAQFEKLLNGIEIKI
jgi:hypothetical protein